MWIGGGRLAGVFVVFALETVDVVDMLSSTLTSEGGLNLLIVVMELVLPDLCSLFGNEVVGDVSVRLQIALRVFLGIINSGTGSTGLPFWLIFEPVMLSAVLGWSPLVLKLASSEASTLLGVGPSDI